MFRALLLFLSLLVIPARGDLLPISRASFVARDRAYYRALSSGLSDQVFAQKWDHARKSPLHFFRAFAPAYYDDFKNVSGLGPIGNCQGDAHYDNFGFLQLADGPHFLGNDLDDAGRCPPALDILRLLVSIELDSELEADDEIGGLATLYAKVLTHPQAAVTIPADDLPDLDKKREKEVRDYTKHGNFELGDELTKISKSRRQEILHALIRKLGPLPFQVKDMAEYDHPDGGSAGLIRYWLLVTTAPSGGPHRKATEEILELKQISPPATDWGGWGKPPEPRIEWAARVLWPGLTPRYYRTVRIGGTDFQLRSRTKKRVHWEDLSGSELRRYLQTETSRLAGLHREAWARTPELIADIPAWLEASTEQYRRRVEKLFAACQD